jgi:hypothetical protein
MDLVDSLTNSVPKELKIEISSCIIFRVLKTEEHEPWSLPFFRTTFTLGKYDDLELCWRVGCSKCNCLVSFHS